MLVLLDENLPHALRLNIVGHDVGTASYQGWNGLSNGTLLRKAEEFGFDVFVSLTSNRRELISGQIASILAAKPGTFCHTRLNP